MTLELMIITTAIGMLYGTSQKTDKGKKNTKILAVVMIIGTACRLISALLITG